MFDKVTEILGVEPAVDEPRLSFPELEYSTWNYQVESHEDDSYFDFINKFLNILEPKFEKLASIGITKQEISIWHLYEYDQQCNMEFHAQELKRLGEFGITLCISCWEKDSHIELSTSSQ